MKSKVYFIKVGDSDSGEIIKAKFRRLLDVSDILDFIVKDDKVVIKMHFGEVGNTGYVRPEYVRLVCDDLAKKQVHHFLSDTNTLYVGKRMNSKDHLGLAYEHGFRPDIVGAEVVIADDTQKETVRDVRIEQEFIKIAKVVKLFLEADAIVSIAHFKGHMMTGFGGALKNIGMGCATREGKLAQHSGISPCVRIEKCTGCEECVKACPVTAISMKNDLAYIDSKKCIGCATCIAVCPQAAIDVNWGAGEGTIQEKMTEYAKAVLKGKENKVAFINFAIKITKECDCLARDDPRIAPDVGIFASYDPVSIDKACFDLINQACGRDIIKEAHPQRDGMKQFKHAEKIGLGNLDYELIDLS
jgi:hypothetical protein